MNGISKETFRELENDRERTDIIFDLLKDLFDCSCKTDERVERLERKFERKKRVDSAVAAGGGLVGGFIAWISSTFINK